MRVGEQLDNVLDRSSETIVTILESRCTYLRRAHPVSILDVSSSQQTTVDLARWLRTMERKSRLMRLEHDTQSVRRQFPEYAEVLVEEGKLPGMHFGEASFDFVVGSCVLAAHSAPTAKRIVREAVASALRTVVFVENDARLETTLKEIARPYGSRGAVTEYGSIRALTVG